ncbi:MAG TPA: hypothetical protein VNS32_28955 [Flavisolibacter sp.]|nr:hypothetical protein [Flavisolibacter sp.]
MKSTKTSQKTYLNIPAEKAEQNHSQKTHSDQAPDMKEKINSSIFTMSPRQYWAGPHFFFNTLYTKKK